MSRLNIAVIGAGYWGKKVIAQILDIARTGDAINLYSVADSSPTALEQCRKEFGPLNYRLDYRELLSDPKVSAVHLCSPNQTHFGIASEFLRQGKHVLVEKPLAMKSKEAYELVRLAREHGSVLCTGHAKLGPRRSPAKVEAIEQARDTKWHPSTPNTRADMTLASN